MKIRLNRFPQGKHKALTMSYDDGVVQDKRLVDVFNQHGIKGSFHVNAGFADASDNSNRLPITQFADLYKGHEISAHGLTHPYLETLSNQELIYEILEDRKSLEEVAGYPVRGMSFPYGSFSQNVLNTIETLGIEYSRTVNSTGAFDIPEQFLKWHPTCHHKDDLLEKAESFLNMDNWEKPSLLYVWGHSYEFDNDKNWGLIEEFCAQISNNPKVWYATNIQVYDYVMAMRRLKFSVNRDMVFNPSCMSVWISVNNESVEIGPGATVKLC